MTIVSENMMLPSVENGSPTVGKALAFFAASLFFAPPAVRPKNASQSPISVQRTALG
jgi:hypothetical protein